MALILDKIELRCVVSKLQWIFGTSRNHESTLNVFSDKPIFLEKIYFWISVDMNFCWHPWDNEGPAVWFTNEIQRKTYLRHRDKLGGSLGCVLAFTPALFHISSIVIKNWWIFWIFVDRADIGGENSIWLKKSIHSFFRLHVTCLKWYFVFAWRKAFQSNFLTKGHSDFCWHFLVFVDISCS